MHHNNLECEIVFPFFPIHEMAHEREHAREKTFSEVRPDNYIHHRHFHHETVIHTLFFVLIIFALIVAIIPHRGGDREKI